MVRFFIRQAATYLDVVEELKRVYVEEAVRELSRSGEKVNASRVSVLTGIYRQEASQLLKGDAEPYERQSIVSRVITRWQTDPQFLTKAGEPRVLTTKGTDSDFHRLVSKVSTTVNPATVLFELNRLGNIRESTRGVRLAYRETRTIRDPERAINSVAQNLSLVIESGEANLVREVLPDNLHIRTEYDNVRVDALPHIRKWFVDEGRKLHRRARKFLSSYDADLSPPSSQQASGMRVALGAFSITSYPPELTANSGNMEQIPSEPRSEGREQE